MRISSHVLLKIFIFTFLSFNSIWGESVARLIKAEGVVYLKRLGMQTYSEVAQLGTSINNGDAIKVGDYGFAALIFIDDRSVVKIKPNSQFEIMDTKNTRSVNIEFGTILNKIEKENRTKTFRVVSPVSVARNLIGPTNGREAAPGTIRGDFGMDIGYNMIHGSDAADTAEFELGLWFPEGVNDWNQDSQSWVYE